MLALLAIAPAAQALDDSSLPGTLRSNDVSPIVGPERDDAYAHGKLGIVRPGYGRASLYVAFRLMQLPPGAVASESHTRVADNLFDRKFKPYRSGAPEIEEWLKARAALVPVPPQPKPDYFRTTHNKVPGVNGGRAVDITATEGNCGADAFTFATHTLHDLVADATLSDTDRRTWIAGQDAVFARCAWVPGAGAAPALPAELPSTTAPKLTALRAYQHASALFYSGDFDHARTEFDAVAATPGNPMRDWAALGAMRSTIRQAVMDAAWQAAFDDAYRRQGLRNAALNTALASASAKHRALGDAAMADVNARFKTINSDPAFADVKVPALYTVRRAAEQSRPRKCSFRQ